MPNLRKQLFIVLRRSFSSQALLRCTNQIAPQYKLFVAQESHKALAEYLHTTQGIPFFFADQIAKNSLFSLSKLTRNLRFSVPAFPATIRKALRYKVINEFEFFLESIGIDHRDIPKYLPRDRFFLSDDNGSVLEASVALFQFGFPWNTLGKLYADKVSIFDEPVSELTARLARIRDRCDSHDLPFLGVCLAFPEFLAGEAELGGACFADLKRAFEGFDNGGSSAEGWYEVCCKIRLLYELGCERGTAWEFIISRGKRVLLECPKKVLEDKVNFFREFGVGKDKLGPFLLRNPEWWALDLRDSVISVSGFLEHFGLDAKELSYLHLKYPHVFGRNRMANLPGIVRALDLREWFCDKIKSLGCQMLVTYSIDRSDKEDKRFQDAVKKIGSNKRCRDHTTSQLDFLMGLGFGENESTLTVLRAVLPARFLLPERFDRLLSLGIRYSELCLMMKFAPRVIRLTPELVEKKVEYLCNEMGSSIKYLDCFPRFLVHDLENRIKPRYTFFVWLRQTGLCTQNYSIKSIIDPSEKRFMGRVLNIHRAALKLYLECYMSKS